MPLTKIAKPLCFIAAAFVAGVILFCALYADSERTRFTAAREFAALPAYLDSAQKEKVPDSFRGMPGETAVFYTTVPDYVGQDAALMLQSAYCSTEVYAGTQLLGSYGVRQPLPFGEMVGNIRVLVRVDQAFAGQQLTIRYTPYYETTVDYPALSFGNTGSLQLYILLHNMPRLVIILILMTMVLAALGMSVYELFGGSAEIVKMLTNFVAFVLCILTWIICSSDLPQFFTNNNETVSLISFLALSILPIPFSHFCAQILEKGRTVFLVSAHLGWILPVTICLCFVTDICDPYHILILTHLYIAFTLVFALICVCRQWKMDRGVAILAVSLMVLFVFALIGLILFYISKTGGYDALFFGFGLSFFILMLFALILNRQMGYYEQKKAAEIYKELAYTDFLTGIPNRTAFEALLADLAADKTPHYVTMFVADLNDLKQINDNFGHQIGDEAIRTVAQCLEKAFRARGSYFRLGGDEFGAIVLDHTADPDKCCHDFRRQVEQYNKSAFRPLSVAIGYAEAEQEKSLEKGFFNTLFSRADWEMYKDKVRLKENEDKFGEGEATFLNKNEESCDESGEM
ncbi:MAG: GGDEF domain-containing protein [Lachnospiraceae bacterium]|nr:GGDEF domain-containing protein [Lachnospiraceae bacterium]